MLCVFLKNQKKDLTTLLVLQEESISLICLFRILKKKECRKNREKCEKLITI
nr:MAG TPA: hypothetical protein [Crassvirales sp.]